MNLFDRLAATFGYTKTQAITSPPAWLVAEGASEQFNIPDRHLPEAQLELYQRLSWVQIAVYQVAAMAATSAFGILQLQGEKKRKVENHPFELLLQRPNPLMSSFELTFSTFADYDLTGSAYWWLNRASPTATPDEIWALPCHKTKPVPDGNMFLRGYEVEVDEGKPIFLELHEVVHFKRYHPLNPFIGLSPIESLAITATTEINMDKYGANFYDKGFAKPQGALAFSDPIPDDQWKVIKKDLEDQHGGTKRKLMTLRGTGAGGVQWVQMALSQKDMEFIESSNFNKEKIFAMYAPGLASMLSVNATEANSIAGKKTFIELGVWPHLVSIQQKITNDVLPAYGKNLVGEFDDIRITDRAMQLSEQNAFAAVHTIDEVRERFYEAQPIGDDRGKLLVAEIGKGMTDASEPPTKEEQMEMQRQQLEAQRTANQQAQPAAEDKPQTEGQPESDEPDEDIREDEAKRFKKWLKKRPDTDVTKFKSDILSEADLVAIAAQLKTMEVGIDQPPFPGRTTHKPTEDYPKITRRLTEDYLKITRKLPGEDGNDEKRKELESYHADKLHAALRKIMRAVAPAGTTIENITPDSAWTRYKENEKLLRDAIVEMLMNGAQLGADTGIAQVEAILGVGKAVSIGGVNWDLVNGAVLQWVLGSTGGGFGTGYGDTILEAMAVSSERQIRLHIAEWIRNDLNYTNLISNLQRTVFSQNRAQNLAITEISRSYAEGTRAAYRQSGTIRKLRWQASNDELTCKFCGHLNGKIIDIDGSFDSTLTDELRNDLQGRAFQIPPCHSRCRCWITGVPE